MIPIWVRTDVLAEEKKKKKKKKKAFPTIKESVEKPQVVMNEDKVYKGVLKTWIMIENV